MELFGSDEQKIYGLLCLDALKDAWKMYNRQIDGVRVVLREHGFPEKEIEYLIEISRR